MWQFDCKNFTSFLISMFKPELCQVRKGPRKLQRHHLQKAKGATLGKWWHRAGSLQPGCGCFLVRARWRIVDPGAAGSQGRQFDLPGLLHTRDDNRGPHVYSFQTELALQPRLPRHSCPHSLSRNLFSNFYRFRWGVSRLHSPCPTPFPRALQLDSTNLLTVRILSPWHQPQQEGHSKDTAFSHRHSLLPSWF